MIAAKWVTDQFSSDSVAGWFRELFPAASVRLVKTAEQAPKPTTWLVADRHHVKEKDLAYWQSSNPSMGLVLRLPLETAALDLAILRLLPLDEVQFETELRHYVQEDVRTAVARRSGAG